MVQKTKQNYIKVLFEMKKKIKLLNNINELFNKIQEFCKRDYYVCLVLTKTKYTYNFNSNGTCTLFDYHNTSLISNCQYVGFFGTGANKKQFQYFISKKGANPLFIFYKSPAFNNVDSKEKYEKSYSDNIEKFMRLSYGETKEISEFGSEIVYRDPLVDEYVLISKENKEIFTINIDNKCLEKIKEDLDYTTSQLC